MSVTVYHLDLDEKKTLGARHAILPGDPQRVEKIARSFDPGARQIAYNREYWTWLGHLKRRPLVVTSTGIGGPSASIAIDELAQLGVRTFIRVGTTGAIQGHIGVGDVIITTGAVRLDGASSHYAPIEFPAVAHHQVLFSLVEAARDVLKTTQFKHHIGITASADTFYPGQERYDSYGRRVIKRFRGSMEEWQSLNILNYEMESATLLTLCSALKGLKGGCVSGVVVNRTREERIDNSAVETAEKNAIDVALRAMAILMEAERD